ncbi:DUF444 family protein [Janthinobacterium lividum]|uniref:DUF444 family protein n=1 Tax=Janthinobacterium lividum TaxID=29581 RepID=UPI0008940074|nr:DUF444 family protein [Janthinobacterium lividum]MCC7713315.1 DUF444 family protein [Janthinobacterium lividum]OEZ61136.1 hypothetical protein JANLI_12220 [Janthinobacterium lividum]WQE26383.1 DUF444 family protein [Janthinobacterium lividum]STQ97278.1 Uncharacterized conserved protein [Janthinobacterium lividum]
MSATRSPGNGNQHGPPARDDRAGSPATPSTVHSAGATAPTGTAPALAQPWYGLFSRGARDWLRHNQKVRDAVQAHLPELIATPDLIGGPQQRTVQVPMRLLEHVHFRLAPARTSVGAGQGGGQPGDLLRAARPAATGGAGTQGEGGDGEGAVRLLLEFPIDDILDWLWDAFELPHLKPRHLGAIDEVRLVRSGLDRHGARSRLDRRRTVKEAIKRRALQTQPVPFTNDDLRYRQVLPQPRPSANAVVFFVLDVSASMAQAERKLAKSFFFFALQGLRRRYVRVETRFIAHTTRAWEFSEAEFFQVNGMGGTMASTAFRLSRELLQEHYAPGRYNAYLFYASDGENFSEDRGATSLVLGELGTLLNYMGYVETVPGVPRSLETEMHSLCAEQERRGLPLHSSILSKNDDIWAAIRTFFQHEAAETEEPP